MDNSTQMQTYLEDLVRELMEDKDWELPEEDRRSLLGDLAFQLLAL